ncbi:MAG: phosphotransferase [Myxococcales bacterium]
MGRAPEELLRVVREATDAEATGEVERIQTLWSGYGEILRVGLRGGRAPSVIVKHVHPPRVADHPRGWGGELSHRRKLRSYSVEMCFYRDWAPRCDAACRVPRLLEGRQGDGWWLMVLEDLDAAGFSLRHAAPAPAELDGCARWLAEFHARFMGEAPEGLWPVGTYWHLDTRPEELQAVRDAALLEAAPRLDASLRGCLFQTLVHGDAKVANFCFGDAGVAAVDFQYVGGGCGMKDVAYFMGSCLSADECELHADSLLESYFGHLRRALERQRPEIDAVEVEAEWRALYPHAWADFHRFLAGWAPDHSKIHPYTRRLTQQALLALGLLTT